MNGKGVRCSYIACNSTINPSFAWKLNIFHLIMHANLCWDFLYLQDEGYVLVEFIGGIFLVF